MTIIISTADAWRLSSPEVPMAPTLSFHETSPIRPLSIAFGDWKAMSSALTPIEIALLAATAGLTLADLTPTNAEALDSRALQPGGTPSPAPAPLFSQRAIDAVTSAWPLPDRLTSLIDEQRLWAALYDEREWNSRGAYEHDRAVEVRIWLLNREIERKSVAAIEALESQSDWERPEVRGDTRSAFPVARDIQPAPKPALTSTREVAPDIQPAPKPALTNTREKRFQACDLIIEYPALTNAEIAERCSLSVNMVAKHRRNLQKYCGAVEDLPRVARSGLKIDVIALLRNRPKLPNKQIAAMTGTTVHTVKTHRKGLNTYKGFIGRLWAA